MEIAELATDSNLLAFARRHAGEYAGDILQDALIVMLELSDDKLQQIKQDGALVYYTRQVIFNMSKRMHKKNNVADNNLVYGFDLSHVPIDNAKDDDELTSNKALDILDELYPDDGKEYPYDKNMFLLYSEIGSCRKVQEVSDINYCSVYRTVKKVRDELRERLMGDM